MPKVECGWILCLHNTFKLSPEMKKMVMDGVTIEGTGECIFDGKVTLRGICSDEDECQDGEYLECEEYEFGEKI